MKNKKAPDGAFLFWAEETLRLIRPSAEKGARRTSRWPASAMAATGISILTQSFGSQSNE